MMKPQFLFLVVVGLGTVANTFASDRDAILELENAGATVQRDLTRKDRPVNVVRFNLRQMSNAALQAFHQIEDLPAIELSGSGDTELTTDTLNMLRGKSSLKRLALAYVKISDESAKILGTIKSLEILEFQSKVEISPRGFNEVLNLSNLKELTLSDRIVNDVVIEQLQGLGRLRVLTLRSLFISDEGISVIGQMTNLTTLRIFAGESISIGGLRLLAALRLKQLEVTYFNASDAGLRELVNASHLHKLRLIDARKISDDCIPILVEMSDLKELEIVGSKLSKAGLKELKKSLPHCKISQVEI